MTLIERLSGLFSRGDTASATLALPGPAPAQVTRQDSVYNPLTRMGGFTDKGAAGRPNVYQFPLSSEELQALYATNGISRRIVDLLPGRATRRGWSSPDIPESEYQRLRAWARVRDAMAMGRLYGDSVLLLVTEDDVPRAFRRNPREWLAQPLDLERIGKLHAIHVFDGNEARPAAWESDLKSHGYRMPSLWSLAAPDFSATVHASRVVVFRGSRRPPSALRGGWGGGIMPDASALQAVWDEIRRLTETMQGGAILAAELREGVLKVGNLASKQVGDEADALESRLSLMSRMKGMLGLTLIGPDDEYENRGNPPTGFKELSEAAQMMLSAVLGWPRTMLTGEAPGGLTSEDASGMERERQIVSDYQETNREEIEYLDSVIYAAQDGPTGGELPDAEERALVFAPLDEPDEKDIAELREIVARTDKTYIDAGVYGPEAVAASRFGEEGWQFDLEPVEVPDPDEDAAVEAARLALEGAAQAAQGQEPPEADEAQEAPRADASGDGCCVLVPAADTGLLGAVQVAIGQVLEAEREPHITVLYLGAVAPEALPEVVAAVALEAEQFQPAVLERAIVRAFPPGPKGTPVVLEFEDAWVVEGLNGRLLRRLAHLCAARQHARFRAHLTLGYAPAPLSPEALTALLAVSAEGVRVPVAMLHVVRGAELAAVVPVSG